MYTLVKWPRDMSLDTSRCSNIVSLNIVPDSVNRNTNQEYNSCIHDSWAMIKDTCHTNRRII